MIDNAKTLDDVIRVIILVGNKVLAVASSPFVTKVIAALSIATVNAGSD